MRETMLPGAVFTRVAASHIRVGTFQYFAARGDIEGIRLLADFAIARHYPEARQSATPYRALLDGVIARQASLIARWLTLGFIHGVMNTDNMSISGETIDFGPCAFMEAYDPATVFSSIDQRGRYSYSNQPLAAHWNLTRLAEAILPLLQQEAGNEEAALAGANDALAMFEPQFEAARNAGFARKLGIFTQRDGDSALVEDLLDRMAKNGADFTLTFRRLCDAAASHGADQQVRILFADPASYDAWAARWRSRLLLEPTTGEPLAEAMRKVNPAFIPRNHQVQAAIEAAENREDYRPFEELLDVTSRPFEDRPNLERYTLPATPTERVLHTFCGT
jgi:uncharacterized protein YdiU (UPF0061 family)